MELDELDKKILDILCFDCRITTTRIARYLGTTQQKVSYRIKKLEKENTIASYDIIPDFTKLSNKNYDFFFIALNKYTEPTIGSALTKKSEVVMKGRFVHPYNYFVSVFQEPSNPSFDTYLREHGLFFRKYPALNFKSLEFSFFNHSFSFSKSLSPKKTPSLPCSLDQNDLLLLEYLANGGGRTPFLKIANDLNLSFDIVSYHFKKLRDNGYFLKSVVQPSPSFTTIQISCLDLKLESVELEECTQQLSLLKSSPYLLQYDSNCYLIVIFSTSFEELKSILDKIYEIFRNQILSSTLYIGKDWEFTNRFNLSDDKTSVS